MTDHLADCPGPAQYDNGGVAGRTTCKGAHRVTALPQMQMSCHQTEGQEEALSSGVKKPEAREGKMSSRNKQDGVLNWWECQREKQSAQLKRQLHHPGLERVSGRDSEERSILPVGRALLQPIMLLAPLLALAH